MRYFYFFIFLFCIHCYAHGQNPIGLPEITNFSPAEYQGGSQNWDVRQDGSGIMYFANNEGLLTYNGQNWNIYPVSSHTILRSIQIGADGKIYAGAEGDVGYFFPDSKGVLKYTSLRHLIPKADASFADVWNISIDSGRVFFRTRDKIFEFADGRMTVFNSAKGWSFSGEFNHRLYAQEGDNQLKTFEGNRWKLVCTLPKSMFISAITTYAKDTALVATLRDGLFLLTKNRIIKKKTIADRLLQNVRINAMSAIDTDLYVVGSAFNGCLVIDRNGNLIENLSKTQSLQNNNIRSFYVDRDKNIWLGLDDGVSFVAFNSAIKRIYPDLNKQSPTYSVKIFDKKLYIGTSSAVFALPLLPSKKDISYNPGQFSEVQNTKGQVWNLNEINDRLVFGNEDGAYQINGYKACPIYNHTGTWLFRSSPDENSSNFIAGTYQGLQLIHFENNKFVDKGPIDGLRETLRFLTFDRVHDVFWSAHTYRGVYKIALSKDSKKIANYRLYTQKDGLPSSLHNYVFNIKGRNVVATVNGLYEYSYQTDRFSPSGYFHAIFKNSELQYLNEDKNGNIWFISNKNVGVVDFSEKSFGIPFTIVYFPELKSNVLAGFENIYPYDDENIFVGANKGVFHINYKQYQHARNKLNILLGQVRAIGDRDSVIFGGYFVDHTGIKRAQNKDSVLTLPHNFNSFHFEFSTTLFEQHSNIEFSYQLVGFDKKWSDWNAKSEKEYTNLGHGVYTFRVKARTNLGNESTFAYYTFEIKPAWYETFWSYLLYTLLVGGLVYGIMIIQQKKHQKAEIHLKYVHQLELEHNEIQIVALKNEKLEAEVEFKNKELATATMHLVTRGKLMSKIKEGLMHIRGAASEDKDDELIKVLRLINEAERSDSDWDQFAIHFDQVHSNFLAKLKNKFPELTQNDLKMCAYLKLNLSSKEIAQLLSITIRAVEVTRYRLRKKLDLPTSVNLFDFISHETA